MGNSTRTLKIDLGSFAHPVDVEAGREVKLKGFYRSGDGAVIDAATTTWPEGSPGGARVDAGGLVDFAGGGFHVTARDPVTHEVTAVATGGEAPACALARVSAPCLPIRTVHLARARLMTRDELRASMKGEIVAELVAVPVAAAPSAYAPVTNAVTSPIAIGGAGVAALAACFGLVWTIRQRKARSPEGRMRALAARIEQKRKRADVALAAALEPVMKKLLAALRDRRVDPRSSEGARVAELLVRVEARIDDVAREERAAKEQKAADELVLEMETALEAAREAARL